MVNLFSVLSFSHFSLHPKRNFAPPYLLANVEELGNVVLWVGNDRNQEQKQLPHVSPMKLGGTWDTSVFRVRNATEHGIPEALLASGKVFRYVNG